MMANRKTRSMTRTISFFDVSDDALECIMGFIDDPRDRGAVSLVCRRWNEIDGRTRKQITIDFCYTTTPYRLRERFPRLESLQLKGKPRAAMFNLMPEDWGGFAEPWIKEISEGLKRIKCLHLRRMIVVDKDLELLARSHGYMLETLKLDKCSGFSTDGLLSVTRSCRRLRTLFLEDSVIAERDGEWLHELALNNTVLETLNFYMTGLSKISVQDLELIAKKCGSLVSIKIGDSEILLLRDFFRSATALEEFAGGSFNEQPDEYNAFILPQTLRQLGPSYMGKDEMHIIFPLASVLKKLNLMYCLLDTEDHCQLLQMCPNLEVLEARNVIGDRGLDVVSRICKRLKRLRIERGGEDEEAMEDEQGVVSQRGLSAIARGCLELEYLAIHVSDITNSSLESLGKFCKNLHDFRLVLLDRRKHITELPLDDGVRALLEGCQKLRRFALYLRAGGLSDVGLGYIGQYSHNVRWMLLGGVGESDAGILKFSEGCPKLQKLEMRGCCFSEHTLAHAITQLTSLRYLWVQQFMAPLSSSDLSAMIRPFWNIEFFPNERNSCNAIANGELAVEQPAQPGQILAYYSLAGQRMDCPSFVVPLYP